MKAKIIAISQGKGGVAKTTTSMNLAGALKEKGFKVLLCDWDIEKPDAVKWMQNSDVIDWVIAINKENPVSQIDALKDEYDVIVFDTPPNYEAGAFKAVMASDCVIIPTSSNYLDQANAQDATSLPLLAKKPFRLLMSKVKKGTRDYKDLTAQVDSEAICFNTIITDRTVMAQCPSQGLWIGDYAKNSDNHRQFAALAEEVIEWAELACHTRGTREEEMA